MKLPFEEYHPATPPERMLAAIHREADRRRRRRRMSTGVAVAAAAMGIGLVMLTSRTAPPCPPGEPNPTTMIRSVEQAGKPVPYTLVSLPGGQVCVVVKASTQAQ
jgi:hypothetical protein